MGACTCRISRLRLRCYAFVEDAYELGNDIELDGLGTSARKPLMPTKREMMVNPLPWGRTSAMTVGARRWGGTIGVTSGYP